METQESRFIRWIPEKVKPFIMGGIVAVMMMAAAFVFATETSIRLPVAPEDTAGAKNVTGTVNGDHYGMDVNLASGAVTTTIYSPSTLEIKKASISATSDSGTGLNPAATSYAVEVCNESDNTVYVRWDSTTASAANGVMILPYQCKSWGGIQISACHVYNAGGDAASVSATYWR